MSDAERTDPAGLPQEDMPEVQAPEVQAPEVELPELEGLIKRLELAADQLRSGDLSTDAAATLVEECAVLANRAGAELERRMHAPPRGQGSLL
jgi:hypothetical protein